MGEYPPFLSWYLMVYLCLFLCENEKTQVNPHGGLQVPHSYGLKVVNLGLQCITELVSTCRIF